MIQVLINDEDRSGVVKFGSLTITDKINQAADVCSFTIDQFGSQTFRPHVNDEVIVNIDGVRSYGGVIVSVDQSMDSDKVISYSVQCKDYTQYLDRKLVTERYEDTNVRAIILDLIDRYADDYGFTADANVYGEEFEVTSVAFNELPLTACFNKLAKLTNYSWYVDSFQDIHFFKKNDEDAPFNLTDTSNNFIFESLVITDDLSQIRNKVKIRGGEARADVRTKKWAGNGNTDTFSTDHKFAELPEVKVGGVTKTVGVDYINKDTDYEVMWNFAQKYVRFTAGNIPPAVGSLGSTNIEITGIPLKPIVVQKQDNHSVAEFGIYEFVKYNDSLKTRDEALQFAQAELEIYANEVREGSFETYTPGLRSGQTISVSSAIRGLNDIYLIQGVTFRQLTVDIGVWRIEMATLRTISMIDILQNLLLEERISEGEDETLLNFFALSDSFGVTDSLGAITATTTRDYLWEQGVPGSDTYSNPIVWNKFTWD